MPQAQDYINRKTITPSELRTAEWNRVDAWIKERSFYMASVTEARTLNNVRQLAHAVAAGKMGAAEAREKMRRQLAASNYQATPGTEDSIKDLRTPQRMRASIDTNVDIARGWAQHKQMLGDILNPGLRLYRATRAQVPRDWVELWDAAAAAVGDKGVAAGSGSFVALSTSPIWRRLSRFGNPHPPFDYGSGMDVNPVSYEDCEKLGLIDESTMDEQAEANLDSLNADLEAKVMLSDEALRRELSESLEGLAEWRDDILVMTDPNGSKSYSPERIGEIIGTPNKAGIPLYQAQAAADFAADPDYFDRSSPLSAPLDEIEDMARLVKRIEPTNSEDDPRALHMALASLQRETTLERLQSQGYRAPRGSVATAWSTGSIEAPMTIRVTKYKSRKRMDDLYSTLGVQANHDSVLPARTQLRYLNHHMQGDKLIVDMEEV